MTLLTDDQKMLQETAASFLADEGAIAGQLRHWRDIGCSDGFGHALWKRFAELGLTGICIPESHGGLGLGATESALVLEEIGRNLTPSPFLTTAIVAARAIDGTAHGERWFPHSSPVTRSWRWRSTKGPRHAPAEVALKARRQGNGFVLDGVEAIRRPRRVRRHDRHGGAHRRIAGRNGRHYVVCRAAATRPR